MRHDIYRFLKHKPFFNKVIALTDCSQRLLIEVAFLLYVPGDEFNQFRLYVLNNWLSEDFDFQESDLRIQRTTNKVENLHCTFHSNNLKQLSDYSTFCSKLVEIDAAIATKHHSLWRGSTDFEDEKIKRDGLTGKEIMHSAKEVVFEMLERFEKEFEANARDYFKESELREWEPYNVFDQQEVPEDYGEFLEEVKRQSI